MKLLPILSLLVLFTACNSQDTTTEKDARLLEMIQGDWKSCTFSSVMGEEQCFTLSVQDSLCSVQFPFPPVSKMKVKNGKLHIWNQSFWQPDNAPAHREYVIAGVTKNYLKLVPTDKNSKETTTSDGSSQSDTIVLKRITKKNNIQPEMISFYSSGCFGTCPSLALEIDALRNARYFGDLYVDTKGGQRGKISEKAYKDLVHVLQLVPLNSLKKKYEAGYTDAQTVCIAVKIDGQWQTCYVYGNSSEPVELRMLFYRLLQLSKDIQWSPAPSITRESFKAYHVRQDVIDDERLIFIPPVATE